VISLGISWVGIGATLRCSRSSSGRKQLRLVRVLFSLGRRDAMSDRIVIHVPSPRHAHGRRERVVKAAPEFHRAASGISCTLSRSTGDLASGVQMKCLRVLRDSFLVSRYLQLARNPIVLVVSKYNCNNSATLRPDAIIAEPP
jgi:hypothetical protein